MTTPTRSDANAWRGRVERPSSTPCVHTRNLKSFAPLPAQAAVFGTQNSDRIVSETERDALKASAAKDQTVKHGAPQRPTLFRKEPGGSSLNHYGARSWSPFVILKKADLA